MFLPNPLSKGSLIGFLENGLISFNCCSPQRPRYPHATPYLSQAERGRMFELMTDEKVIDSFGPLEKDNRLKTCSQCPQIAFRVLRLKSESRQREVSLCGAHFIEACSIYPDVRRVASMRRAI
jgi:hypothetical protein